MAVFAGCAADAKMQEMSAKDRFTQIFSQLEDWNGSEQRHMIEELDKIAYEMHQEEFNSVFGTKLFDEMDEMIEEEKLPMENAILLLERIGYCKLLRNFWMVNFDNSRLCKRLKEMICEEEEEEEERKRRRKNPKLLIDLCECCAMLRFYYNSKEELPAIAVPCLLKVGLNKKGSREAQKEVEMAVLALSNIGSVAPGNEDLYFNEMREIIQHHQEHRNLTRLAYQSAWKFLINRLRYDKSFEENFVNELKFIREASRELEELTKCVDWKKKDGEEREGKERKEKWIILKWILAVQDNAYHANSSKEERMEFIRCLGKLCKTARVNEKEIYELCITTFRHVADIETVFVDVFQKEGIFDLLVEEIQQSALKDKVAYEFLAFFLGFSKLLKREAHTTAEEEKKKEIKRKIFEMMEEKGHEDAIVSFQGKFDFLKRKYYYNAFSLNISDYFVSV
ncbi:uncharacterized protein MONOS_17381 [Monocercomonoides exilis]|uniref:uncharacterized protein n=1 Tax=Monocercomonoides exilis TaxID=2049356 RepID=UPI003559508B|nr:hypothetical protein MONOS_17381 [Monocercomonoides exilis]